MRLYHSAVKGVGDREVDAPPLTWFEHGGCTVRRWDIIEDGLLAPEFAGCDVIYADTPWPHGFQSFEDSAGIARRRHFSDFAKAIHGIITQTETPIFLTLGKALLKQLPEPAGLTVTKLKGMRVTLAWWHPPQNYRPRTFSDTLSVARMFAAQGWRMGDFCCGYGHPLFEYLAHGGASFAASDYNPKCIGVMARLLNAQDILGHPGTSTHEPK